MLHSAALRVASSGNPAPAHVCLFQADYAMTPSMAVVDPQLVLQLPRAQTAYGGALTLAHALESYISVFATGASLKV